eukprot:Em0010g544a
MPSALKVASEPLSFSSSSHRMNPAYATKHTANNLTSVRDGAGPAASTMAFNISAVTGSFRTLGLANIRRNPSKRYFLVVLSALLLSTVAGRDCANLLSSGSSRLPSNGQAPAENTPVLKNDRLEVHHSYKAQDSFLLGGRTLTTPAARLFPPRRQDSHHAGGRTLSSPAAGLSPPRRQDSPPRRQDSFLPGGSTLTLILGPSLALSWFHFLLAPLPLGSGTTFHLHGSFLALALSLGFSVYRRLLYVDHFRLTFIAASSLAVGVMALPFRLLSQDGIRHATEPPLLPLQSNDTPPQQQDSFLPSGRTLSSPVAGLFPPQWQDSFLPKWQDSLLPGGRTLSSPVAGLSSPVAGLSPPWWQDYRLGPSPWLTVAYTPSVPFLPGGRTLSSPVAGTLTPPLQQALCPPRRQALSPPLQQALCPPRRQALSVLPGGRHTHDSAAAGTPSSQAAGVLSSPAVGTLCPPRRQAHSLLRGSRHSILSGGMHSVLPGGKHYWATRLFRRRTMSTTPSRWQSR